MSSKVIHHKKTFVSAKSVLIDRRKKSRKFGWKIKEASWKKTTMPEFKKRMKIIKRISPHYSEFCFGVSWAVNAAYSYMDGSVFMCGEVVHNPTVSNNMQNREMRLNYPIDEI